jgi:hypothetical protein
MDAPSELGQLNTIVVERPEAVNPSGKSIATHGSHHALLPELEISAEDSGFDIAARRAQISCRSHTSRQDNHD